MLLFYKNKSRKYIEYIEYIEYIIANMNTIINDNTFENN